MVMKVDTINYYDPKSGDPATRRVEVEVVERPVKDEAVKIGGGKTVVVQVGPTPGEAYAVFAKNPAYHEEEPDAWARASRQALEMWAGKGNRTVSKIMNEHGRSMNLKLEYTT